jgi:hypothetical protein
MNPSKDNQKLRVFDFSKWHEKIMYTPLALLEISKYVKEKDLVAEYINRKKDPSGSDSLKISEMPYKEQSFYQDFVKSDLQSAVKILSRQMVVLAATYIEGILYEFLLLFFSKHPEKMHDYIRQDISKKGSGKVTLHEIIHATSKEDLIYKLAERASLQATFGKFSVYIKKIETISKCNLSEDIGEIIDLRNKLVHETKEPEISVEDVFVYYDNLEKMIIEIGKTALENEIEVKGDLDLLKKESPF